MYMCIYINFFLFQQEEIENIQLETNSQKSKCVLQIYALVFIRVKEYVKN